MKLSSSEEYGLRCLLQLARQTPGSSLTIPEISQAEGITHHNVAKLLRILRQGGLVESARGQQGGYALAKPPDHPAWPTRSPRWVVASSTTTSAITLPAAQIAAHTRSPSVRCARCGGKSSRPLIKSYRAQPSPTCSNRATP